jgi:hypothetical protein
MDKKQDLLSICSLNKDCTQRALHMEGGTYNPMLLMSDQTKHTQSTSGSLQHQVICEPMYDEVRRFLASKNLGLHKVDWYRDVRYFYWSSSDTATPCNYIAIIPLTYDPAPRIHARVLFHAYTDKEEGHAECVSNVSELTLFLERCFDPREADRRKQTAMAAQYAKRLVATWAKGIAERVVHEMVEPLFVSTPTTTDTLRLSSSSHCPQDTGVVLEEEDSELASVALDPHMLQEHLITCIRAELMPFSSDTKNPNVSK